jgi:hypothetical protein
MPAPGREPSMEDILASIKKVIAEEKELRSAADATQETVGEPEEDRVEEDVLELDEPLPPADLGPPLLDEETAEETRHSLQDRAKHFSNHFLERVDLRLRWGSCGKAGKLLKQWLDENLPEIVNEHVRREISRITGRPV